MGYEVIGPVTDIKVGVYGAAEEACVSMGGINKFSLKYKEKVEPITSAAKGMAIVGKYGYAAEADCELEGDQITLENLARAMRGVVDGDSMLVTGNGGMLEPHALYVYGLAADGSRKKMYVPAFVFEPENEIAPDYKQQTWKTKGSALRDDTLGGMYEYQPNPTVATIPTLTASTPDVDGTMALAGTAALTFAVSLDAADVNTRNIFMLKISDNSFVPCTVTQVAGVVSVNPVSNLAAAGAEYTIVVRPGLRSLSGVVNPLGYSIPFTTV